VPRAIFKGSAVFEDMYALPQAQGIVADGSDDDHPLDLSVTYTDFESFFKSVMTW
jgi:hypothetical protein